MYWKTLKFLGLVLLFSRFPTPIEAQTENTLTHEEVLAFVSQTTGISACRVRTSEQGPTLGPKLALGSQTIQELRKILLNPASYEEGGHRCVFSPNYLLILSGKNGRMNILLCYGCRDYQASMGPLKSPLRSFAPSSEALKSILTPLGLKDP